MHTLHFSTHPVLQAANGDLERVDQRGSNIIFYFSDVRKLFEPYPYPGNVLHLASAKLGVLLMYHAILPASLYAGS